MRIFEVKGLNIEYTINSLNSIFNSLNSNIHSMFDIEFSEFIAIFDVCGVLIFTVYSKLRVLISNIHVGYQI